MKTIACYSIKGGVGKTALAVNLAYAMSRDGHRTLLVDLDPQCAAAFYFRIRAAGKLKLKNQARLADRLRANIRESDYPGLHVLPSNLAYRNFDLMFDRMKKSRKQLRNLLRTLAEDYDMAILDCPPNITLLSENVFQAADAILVPVIPTTLSQRTYDQLVEFFQAATLPPHRLVPFFSMVQRRSTMHRTLMEELRSRYPCFLHALIPFSADIEKMGFYRKPVLTYASSRSGVQAYHALCREILERVT